MWRSPGCYGSPLSRIISWPACIRQLARYRIGVSPTRSAKRCASTERDSAISRARSSTVQLRMDSRGASASPADVRIVHPREPSALTSGNRCMYLAEISTNISSVSRPSMAALPGRALRPRGSSSSAWCPARSRPTGRQWRPPPRRTLQSPIVVTASYQQHGRQRARPGVQSVGRSSSSRTPIVTFVRPHRSDNCGGSSASAGETRERRPSVRGSVTAHGVLLAVRKHDYIAGVHP